ncbi:restriction endonuclease subunit S [Sporosarcina koreensis]|uniref:restriction endonuclease subunit S n=1 Tax=Sporosarcina koreensis TaxID=334735 RepID=UPI0005912A2F|nr:restriction endonuclease subunit S [Sporosarcina koreensis]
MLTREIKDSGIEWIGEFPKGWKYRKIGNYFNQVKDKNNDLLESNLLSLSYGSVIRRDINTSDGLLPANFSSYNIVHPGDIVLRMTDLQNDQTSLRTGYVTEKGIITSAYITIRPKDLNVINPKYIHLLLHSFDIVKGFYGMGSGVRQNVTFNDIKKLPFMLPPKEIQDEIIILLEEKMKNINDIIINTGQSVEELKKYKQSIITEAVTKGLNPNVEMIDSGIEVIGKVKSNYNIIPLGYLGMLQNGISKSGDYFGEGYPFVSYGDVYHNRVLPYSVKGLVKSTENDQEIYSVKKGDIFFTRTSEIIEEVGMASVCLHSIDQATFAGFLIRFRPTENIPFASEYARYYLEASFIRDFFAKEMNLVTRASLSQPLLKKLPIIIPSLKEQQEIVSYLNEHTKRIDTLIQDKERVIEELEQYKKSLIYEYVTGKIEV